MLGVLERSRPSPAAEGEDDPEHRPASARALRRQHACLFLRHLEDRHVPQQLGVVVASCSSGPPWARERGPVRRAAAGAECEPLECGGVGHCAGAARRAAIDARSSELWALPLPWLADDIAISSACRRRRSEREAYRRTTHCERRRQAERLKSAGSARGRSPHFAKIASWRGARRTAGVPRRAADPRRCAATMSQKGGCDCELHGREIYAGACCGRRVRAAAATPAASTNETAKLGREAPMPPLGGCRWASQVDQKPSPSVWAIHS